MTAAAPNVLDDLAALPRPRKHYQLVLFDARSRRRHAPRRARDLHAFLRAYYHHKSADWKGNRPFRLAAWSAAELAENADLLHHGPGRRAWPRPSRPRCRRPRRLPLPMADRAGTRGLRCGVRPHRLPGRPQLVSLPHGRRCPRRSALFSGRTIDVPSCFIAGASDWGVYQGPVISKRCRRAPARRCSDATSSREPGTGCSRSNLRVSPRCCWISWMKSRRTDPVPCGRGERQSMLHDALARGALELVDHHDVARVLVGREPLGEPGRQPAASSARPRPCA